MHGLKGEIMKQAQNGDTAKVHYTGKLSDGTVFDSSQDRDPLEFVVGEGQLIKGFDDAVIGMNVGDAKTVVIPEDKAYGPRNDEMVFQVNRDQLPGDMEPQVGMQLQTESPDGQPIMLVISEIAEEGVTLDANHPLAGKELTFEIKLVDVASA